MNVSVLIWIILLFKGGTRATTKMTEYTFLPEYQSSANDAADICKSREEELLKMDTLEIFHALTVFFQNSTLAIKQNRFWTGLHFPSSLGTSGYRWADCSPLLSPIFFKETTFKENCVSVQPKELVQRSDVWISEKCKSTNSIICQKTGGECAEFKQFPSYIHLSSDAGNPVETSSIPGILTKEMCQLQCLSSQHQDCLGFTLLAGQCTLYFAESIADIWTQANSTTGLYIKFCYLAVVENDVVKPEIYMDELEPIRLCTLNTTQNCSSANCPNVLSVSTAEAIHNLKITNNDQTTQQQTSESDSNEETDISSTQGATEANIIISTTEAPGTDNIVSVTSTETVNTVQVTSFTRTEKSSEALYSIAWTSLDTTTAGVQDDQASESYSATPVHTLWNTIVLYSTPEPFSTRSVKVVSTGSIITPLLSTHDDTIETQMTSTIAPTTIELTTPTMLENITQDDKEDVVSLQTTGSEMNCLCPCRNNRTETILTVEEKTELIISIVQNLSKNKDNLSSTVRRKTSAHDHRPSSKGIGVLAIVFLVMVFGGIVVADFPVLVREMRIRMLNGKTSDNED